MLILSLLVSLSVNAQTWAERERQVNAINAEETARRREAYRLRDIEEFLFLATDRLPRYRTGQVTPVTGVCSTRPETCNSFSCSPGHVPLEELRGRPYEILGCEVTLADNSVCSLQYRFDNLLDDKNFRKSLHADCWDARAPKYGRWSVNLPGATAKRR